MEEPSDQTSFEVNVGTPGVGLLPLYVNRFHLWANDQVLRIVLGDSVTGSEVDYKSMFVMTRSDAQYFAELISTLLAETDPNKTET